jgi:hypothetical protein
MFDHVEGYVPQHAFLCHVPNLMKIIMSSHIVLLTWKLFAFQVISLSSFNLHILGLREKIEWQMFIVSNSKHLNIVIAMNDSKISIIKKELATSNYF